MSDKIKIDSNSIKIKKPKKDTKINSPDIDFSKSKKEIAEQYRREFERKPLQKQQENSNLQLSNNQIIDKLSIVSNIPKEIEKDIDHYSKQVKNKVDDTKQNISDRLNLVGTQSKNIKDSVKKNIEKITKENKADGLNRKTSEIKQAFDNKIERISQEATHYKKKLENSFDSVKHPIQSIKNSGSNFNQSLKNKAFRVGLDAKDKAAKIFKDLKSTKSVSFLATNWKLLLLAWFILIIIIALLSLLMLVGRTPHYYCSVNAPSEIKKSDNYKMYCGVGGQNDGIASAALSLADEYYVFDRDRSISNSEVEYILGKHVGKLLYIETFREYSEVHTKSDAPNTPEANCIGFVNTALNWAGVKDAPKRNPADSIEGMRDSEYWEEVDFSESDPFGTLEPGDVLLSEYYQSGISHTFIWVGTEAVQEMYPELDTSYAIVEAGWEEYGAIVSNYENYWFDGSKQWHAFRYIGELDPK